MKTSVFVFVILFQCCFSFDLFGRQTNFTLYLCTEKSEKNPASLGCECPDDDQVHIVNCAKRNAAVVGLPSGIDYPSHVTEVTFRDNQIADVTQAMFQSGDGLTRLDLSRNKIKFVSSPAFAKLVNLKHLNLSHNDIWTLSAEMLQGLDQLESLDLSYNGMSSFFPNSLQPCVALKELILKYNPILFLDSFSFEMLPVLQIIDLSSTGLTNLPSEVFAKNPKLETVRLMANVFQSVPRKGLASAKGLKDLDISENPIEVLKANSFKGLDGLETLTANHMGRLIKIESKAFRGMSGLTRLYMSDNIQLSFISETAFSDYGLIQDLEELFEHRSLLVVNFKHCGITSFSQNLLRWDQLVELDLSENPLNCDCRVDWIPDSSINPQSKKTMTCSKPSHLGGKLVVGLEKSDFTCRLLSLEGVISLSLLVSLTFMVALGALLFVVYRKNITEFLRRRKEQKYIRVINTKDKIDLEWDHEPFTKSTDA